MVAPQLIILGIYSSRVDINWIIIPLTIDISPINHSEIGLIHQLGDLELGHHLVDLVEDMDMVLYIISYHIISYHINKYIYIYQYIRYNP